MNLSADGNVNGCLADFASVGSHQMMIDNVSLHAVEQVDVDAVTEPQFSLASQPVFGENVVLTYTDNSVWEKEKHMVTVEGREISSTDGKNVFHEIGKWSIYWARGIIGKK